MPRRKDRPEDAAPEAATETATQTATKTEAAPVEPAVEVAPSRAVPDSEIIDAPPPPEKRPAPGAGILGPLVGGAMAAIAGFGLSHFNVFGLRATDQTAALEALTARLEAKTTGLEAGQAGLESSLRQEIIALGVRLGSLEAAPAVDLSGLAEFDRRLQAIEAVPPVGEASTTALAAQLADLQRRLDALPSTATTTAEVDAALARLAEVEAEAQARADAAAAAVETVAKARALEELAATAATNVAFEAELAAVADPELQAQLAPFSGGVASVTDLRAAFPEAARAALQVARATDTEAGWSVRLIDFLGAQTGARSLEPRQGDSADAILSRAEFALSEGRLVDALAELDALSPDLQAALADWRTRAEARMAVDTAVAEGQ